MTNNAVRQPSERQRAIEATNLRRRGLTWREIAAQLNFRDESGARHAVTRLLARVESESVAELRQIESERLDALQAGHWDAAAGGDVDSARVVLGVIDRRMKLHGLAAPLQVDLGAQLTADEFAARAIGLVDRLNAVGGADELRAAGAVLAADSRNPVPEGASPSVHPLARPGAFHGADDWSNIGGNR